MKSMTGYGLSKISADGLTIEVEIRSWNHKGLDIQFRLPDSCNSMEQELRTLIADTAMRGKIICSIHLKGTFPGRKMLFNEDFIRELITHFKKIAEENKIQPVISISDLKEIPGALEVEEEIDETLLKKITDVLKNSFESWDSARIQEGKKMESAINLLLEELEKAVDAVSSRRKPAVEELRTRLSKRLCELIETHKTKFEANRLEAEVAMLAEKMDIEEEIVRLKSHILTMKKLIESDKNKSIGQEIGFILQETLREVNTIGSKCQDLEITQAVIHSKTAIDRMRELNANVV